MLPAVCNLPLVAPEQELSAGVYESPEANVWANPVSVIDPPNIPESSVDSSSVYDVVPVHILPALVFAFTGSEEVPIDSAELVLVL